MTAERRTIMMRKSPGQFGFSLVEMVVVLAVILILAGALLGVGKYMTVRASVDLTVSELEVLATALEQYYDDYGTFPLLEDTNGDGYDEDDLGTDLGGTVTPADAINDLVDDGDPAAASAALYYFLDQHPNSRSIVSGLSASLVTTRDAAGQVIGIIQPAGSGTERPLPRFVDAWEKSILYEYRDGQAFPKLTSAGPDKRFGTGDDLSNP